jgi:hypothetical protein
MSKKHNFDEDVLFNQIADLCFEWIEKHSSNSRGRNSRQKDLQYELFYSAIGKRMKEKYPLYQED